MSLSAPARLHFFFLLAGAVLICFADRPAFGELAPAATKHWTADNGNGTYSNPLFYEEFEDPDINLLLIDKRAYDQLEPDRGEMVITRYTGDLIVKRVVGRSCEEVEVRQGRLYVNGRRVKENHAIYPGYLFVGKGKLFPGDFATLGDNRAVSPARAVHPSVNKSDILGKVVFVLKTKTL
jgi:signal peptidase I